MRGLQRRFDIPIPAESPNSTRPPNRPTDQPSISPTVPPSNSPTVQPPTSYTEPYLSFLATVIHLRALSIPEDTLIRLWSLERKLMQLLHADSTGSLTWFLDACGSTVNPDHCLLLSNFDIGVYLPNQELGEKSRICNQVKVVGRLKVYQGAYFDIGQRDTPINFELSARRQVKLR